MKKVGRKLHNERVRVGYYIFALIKSVLLALPAPPLPDGLSWSEIYELAREHTVANLIYHAFGSLDVKPDEEILRKFDRHCKVIMVQDSCQEREIANISTLLEREGVRFMLLKGSIMKKLYPSTDMRQMGDIDILVAEQEFEKAEGLIASIGYLFASRNSFHAQYHKPPSIKLELHKTLFDECFTKINEYFGSGFERAVLTNGAKYSFSLSPEDFYIYMIAHLEKHYNSFGTGIRSVTDIWVFNRFYSDKLDRKYISIELKKLGLIAFEKQITQVTRVLFEDEKSNAESDTAISYIIESGAYGKAENNEFNHYLRENPGDTKLNRMNFILRTVFPGRAYMAKRYRILEKCGVLLPIFWAVRIVSTLLQQPKNIKYRLSKH